MIVNIRIGDLCKKYETSGKGPGFISDGESWGDPGGTSYGSYQLESKLGTLQAYLSTDDKYTKALKPYKINSLEFKNKWRVLAAEDPEGFENSQFQYLANKPNGYVDAYNWAKARGWAVYDLAIQSAIYSTVNQSGRWKQGIFSRANIVETDSIVDQVNKLYDARANYFRGLKLSPMIKKNIIEQRTVQERKDVLKLIDKL